MIGSLDTRESELSSFLQIVNRAATMGSDDYTNTQLTCFVVKLFEDGSKETRNSSGLVESLESFFPKMGKGLESFSDKMYGDLLDAAQRDIPRLISLWKNFDLQRVALVEIHDVLRRCAERVVPGVPHTLLLDPSNFLVDFSVERFYLKLMELETIGERDFVKAKEVARDFFKKLADYSDADDRADLEDRLANFEAISLVSGAWR